MLQLRHEKHVILIVDDVPDNLALLSDALDEAGYMVLVATDGLSALELLGYATPHLILLDAVMPGLDGFDTCRRIRALPATSHVPVIFMTGLTETEHVLKGFEVGGNDYVVKPFQPREVIARIEAHLRNASMIALATTASEAAAHAVIVLDRAGAPIWQTSKAQEWLAAYFPAPDLALSNLPLAVQRYVNLHFDSVSANAAALAPLLTNGSHATLSIRFSQGERSGDLLLILEQSEALSAPAPATRFSAGASSAASHASIDTAPAPSAPYLNEYQLTPREHDVLAWLTKGKTNRDIAEILGMSPRTVNKHLEHIFVKMGVETRSAAAALALASGQAH